jgi:hypothetical protein
MTMSNTIEVEMPHCDHFEKIIKDIKFREYPREELDAWTGQLVSLYCEGKWPLGNKGMSPIRWELGDISLKVPGSDKPSSKIIRLYDLDGITYLESFPVNYTFMWVKDEAHTESVHPDQAMLILLTRSSLVNGSVMIDEKGGSIMNLDIDGKKIQLKDLRER